jgi:hypothetical protein
VVIYNETKKLDKVQYFIENYKNIFVKILILTWFTNKSSIPYLNELPMIEILTIVKTF